MYLLKACSLLLTAVWKDSRTESINVNFTKEDILADLKALVTNNGIRYKLERKDLSQPDSVVLFVAALVDGEMRAQFCDLRQTSTKTLLIFYIG